MGARQKLNSMYFVISAMGAAIAGFIFKSLVISVICFGGLMAAFLHDGSLRPGAVKPQRRTRKRR